MIRRELFDLFDTEIQPGGNPEMALALAREIRASSAETARLDDLYSPKRVEVTVQRRRTGQRQNHTLRPATGCPTAPKIHKMIPMTSRRPPIVYRMLSPVK